MPCRTEAVLDESEPGNRQRRAPGFTGYRWQALNFPACRDGSCHRASGGVQQQARRGAAFRPERQAFAKRQHVGWQDRRELHQNSRETTDLKPDLGCGKRFKRAFGGDQDDVARIAPERGEAETVRPSGFSARSAILNPQNGPRQHRLPSADAARQRTQDDKGKPGRSPLVTRARRMQCMDALARISPPQCCKGAGQVRIERPGPSLDGFRHFALMTRQEPQSCTSNL